MQRNYFAVRAMGSTESDFQIFFNNSVVAVGWSEIDFTQYPKEKTNELKDAVYECYYSSEEKLPQVIGRQLNQVSRFHNINKGDYIIIPFYNSIRLAIAEDQIIYNEEEGYDADLSNQRKVSYLYSDKVLKTIPRDFLTEALQRRLRVRGSTILDLFEFKDEIEKLFNGGGYVWTAEFEENEKRLKNELKKKLLAKIVKGKTHLKTGGIGLEHLVQELFECEKYKSEVLAKGLFQYGDADVYAVKADKFQETKVLAQVKHHSGYTNEWGLQQLNEIKKEEKEYSDYKFVLITSAEISQDVRKLAENLDIIAMNGNDLIEWIIENIEQLSAETKIKLGISSIPQINE